MPVAHQIEHGAGGGQRQPGADASAGLIPLRGGEQRDANDGQVTARRPGNIALGRFHGVESSLRGLFGVLTFLDTGVDDAHGDAAHGDDDKRHECAELRQQPACRRLAAQGIKVKARRQRDHQQ